MFEEIYTNENEHAENDFSEKIRQLTVEKDKYEQEVHSLREKLKTMHDTYSAFADDNENVLKQSEISFKKKINQIHEKCSADKKMYEKEKTVMSEIMEKKEQEILELKKIVEELKLKCKNNGNNEKSFVQPYDCNDKQMKYEQKIKELMKHLTTVMERNKNLQMDLDVVNNETESLKKVLEIVNKNLEEKSQQLEIVRENYKKCENELNALQFNSDEINSKGNSVFSELEESRNRAIDMVNKMKTDYLEMKRQYKLLENDNLKMKSEKRKLINEWLKESTDIFNQQKKMENTTQETIKTLQRHISEIKKSAENDSKLESQKTSLLESRIQNHMKEIETLKHDLECCKIKQTILEEQLLTAKKECRHWKYQYLAAKGMTEVEVHSEHKDVFSHCDDNVDNTGVSRTIHFQTKRTYKLPKLDDVLNDDEELYVDIETVEEDNKKSSDVETKSKSVQKQQRIKRSHDIFSDDEVVILEDNVTSSKISTEVEKSNEKKENKKIKVVKFDINIDE